MATHASFKINGLDELREELRRLPAELRDQGRTIVLGQANGAAASIRAAYPKRAQTLADSVMVTTFDSSQFGAGATVKNTAYHAWMFENGTQARHTALGANRGVMPAGHVFIPELMRHRRAMWQQLTELLRTAGLQVSGDAGG